MTNETKTQRIFNYSGNLFISVPDKIITDNSIIVTGSKFDSVMKYVQKPVEADFVFIKNGEEIETDKEQVVSKILETVDIFNTACTNEVEFTGLMLLNADVNQDGSLLYDECPLVYRFQKLGEIACIKNKYVDLVASIGEHKLTASRDGNMFMASYKDNSRIYILGMDWNQYKNPYIKRLEGRM